MLAKMPPYASIKKISLLVLFIAVPSIHAASIKNPAADSAAILSELPRQSGLTETELNHVLADCNASQQAMYFCAWRDRIAVEREFQHALDEKKSELADCKQFLDSRAAIWKKSRDRSCIRSANKTFGESSMKPTPQAMCESVETSRMTNRLKRIADCNRAGW